MDAPVSGGDVGAKTGTLTIIAGGRAEDFNRCLDIFKVMGKAENIFHVGPVGNGQTVKMVNQFIGGITMAAIAEGLVLGIKAGATRAPVVKTVAVDSPVIIPGNMMNRVIKKMSQKGRWCILTMIKRLRLPSAPV